MNEKLTKIPGFGDWIELHRIKQITVQQEMSGFFSRHWTVNVDGIDGLELTASWSTREEAQECADKIAAMVNDSLKPKA